MYYLLRGQPRKSYSRDYLCVGRLRYLLHKPDSEELYNPEIPDSAPCH
jgi:hypothetical protein